MIQLGHLVNVWKPNRINRNYSKFEGKWQNASGKASTQERNGKRQQKQTKRNPLDPKWMNSSNLISLLIFLIFSSFNFHQKFPSNQETRRLSSTARSKHPKARRSGDAMAHNSPEAKEVESACPNSPSHWTILDFQLPAAKFVAGNLNYASNLKWSMLRT